MAAIGNEVLQVFQCFCLVDYSTIGIHIATVNPIIKKVNACQQSFGSPFGNTTKF